MSKLALFLALSCVLFLTSCKVSKNVQKSSTETETQNKVDSSGVKRNDITKEEETKTITEVAVDTSVLVTGVKAKVKGDTTLSDGTKVEFTSDGGVLIAQPDKTIPIKGKKRTETTTKTKEVDKSKSEATVKKKEEKKESKKEKGKEVTKTGFVLAWYWFILIVLALLIAIGWKLRKYLPFF